jgi:hypothetical protein
MSHADSLKLLTLDLISPARRVEQSQVDALTPADWTEILRMARQHRIGPMMRWQLKHAHAHLHVPPDVAAALDQQFRLWTVRMMMIQRELLRVHEILEAAGIPHVFLKGTHLAFGLYPNPAMRPVRDIDVLAPGDAASDAYAALVKGGFLPSKRHWHEILSAEAYEHSLPELRAPGGGVCIDIHRRLLRMHGRKAGTLDPSAHPSFWSSHGSAAIAGTQVPASPPEALLVHLAAHAALEHHFDNGPLLISDAAYLLQRHTIEWPALWQMAESVGCTRALALTLAVCSNYGAVPDHAVIAIPRSTDSPSSELVTLATVSLLSPAKGSHEIRVLERLRQKAHTGSWLLELWKVACPPRQVMAYVYDTSPNSLILILRYPQRWWNLLSRRARAFVPLLHDGSTGNPARRIRLMVHWLTTNHS